jgi:hypothetical protein
MIHGTIKIKASPKIEVSRAEMSYLTEEEEDYKV